MTLQERIEVYRIGIDRALNQHGFSLVTLYIGRTGGGQAFWKMGVEDREARSAWSVAVPVGRHFEADFDEIAVHAVSQINAKAVQVLRGELKGTLH